MDLIKNSFKVAINTSYGGYRLSEEAVRAIAERRGCTIVNRGGESFAYFMLVDQGGQEIDPQDLPRTDTDLIAVVEALGPDRAGADGNRIVVREVGITVEIDNYDGKEEVRVYGSAC